MSTRIILGALSMVMLTLPATSYAQEQKTIWDGVYTQAQADRGKKVNDGVCSKCHGLRGDGANEPDQPGGPSIARHSFLRKWDGSGLGTLYGYIETAMPPDNPGSRTDQEYLDVIAYMLQLSGAPVGETELPLDPVALDEIMIAPKPQ